MGMDWKYRCNQPYYGMVCFQEGHALYGVFLQRQSQYTIRLRIYGFHMC